MTQYADVIFVNNRVIDIVCDHPPVGIYILSILHLPSTDVPLKATAHIKVQRREIVQNRVLGSI